MRVRNIVLFVCVWLAAYGMYMIVNIAGQILFSPVSINVHFSPISINGQVHASSVTEARLHFGGSFVVAALAGALLCRFVDSAVPLKWCLGLGLIFAGTHLLPYFLSDAPVAPGNMPASAWQFTLPLALGYALAPVLAGYLVKRRNHHVN
jgi:hypothetical protein